MRGRVHWMKIMEPTITIALNDWSALVDPHSFLHALRHPFLSRHFISRLPSLDT
jgi:hypothetical protein